MKSTQLSDEEINKLFAFVKSKYVYFIDMQHELVDHLACEIEELQSANENLAFKDALNKVYAKYPITGFSNLKDAKIKAMNKYWMRVYFQYILGYFKLPKVIITLLFTYLYFCLFGIVSKPIAIVIFAFFAITDLIILHRMQNKFTYEQKQKYLFLNAYYGWLGVPTFFTVFLPFHMFEVGNYEINFSIQIVLALFAAYHTIMYNAKTNVFPQKLENDIKQKYPYLKLKTY